MANCADCVHIKICQKTRIMNPANNHAEECMEYKDSSLFVELPCKVGDRFYAILSFGDGYHIRDIGVEEIHICQARKKENGHVIHGEYKIKIKPYRKKIVNGFDNLFETYEEAKQALAEKKRGI